MDHRAAGNSSVRQDDPMTITENRGVAAMLDRARVGMRRLAPPEALAAVAQGALLVDTRTETQRREQGELPGALVIDRTVLEWRLDPASPDRIPEATGYDLLVIVVCRQGYSSSLAAAGLREIGLHRATDLAGGMEAWLAAGLPVTTDPADVRR
jgi:rhodanese-related sulfurtransferase